MDRNLIQQITEDIAKGTCLYEAEGKKYARIKCPACRIIDSYDITNKSGVVEYKCRNCEKTIKHDTNKVVESKVTKDIDIDNFYRDMKVNEDQFQGADQEDMKQRNPHGKLLIEGSNSCEDFEWEDLTSELTTLMEKRNPSGIWEARVSNFGWRSQDGYKDSFKATTGADLLSAILPNTDCHFKIYDYNKTGFAIDNAHHDKPMGGELYYIIPSIEED